MRTDHRKTGISLGLIAAVVGLGYWQANEPKPLPDDFHARAQALAGAGKHEEMLALCAEALAVDPKHFDAHLFRADHLRKTGRQPEAITDLDIALKADPKHHNAAHAYYCRGRAYYDLSQFKQSIPDFSRVIEISSKEMWSHYYRGLCYENLKQPAKALDDYYVVIEQNPAEPEIRLRMAALEIELGRYEAAEATLKTAEAVAGTNTTVAGRADVLNDKRLKLMAATN